MISGLTPHRGDDEHSPRHCPNVPAVHAAIRVLSRPAHPIPNHHSVEAGLRNSYRVATESVLSRMQATGSAAKEIPLQRQRQPAPEEPASWARKLSWQTDLRKLPAAGKTLATFSFPTLASVREKDPNHYISRTIIEAWFKGNRKGEGEASCLQYRFHTRGTCDPSYPLGQNLGIWISPTHAHVGMHI